MSIKLFEPMLELEWKNVFIASSLFPPEKDATGNTSTYYNVNDYSDIIAQERPGTIGCWLSKSRGWK